MPDIRHDFPVAVPIVRAFEAVSRPNGLDQWWTLTSEGAPGPGAAYVLGFGPAHQWRAVVSDCDAPRVFELTLTEADDDWRGSRVRFEFVEQAAGTLVRFAHLGWPSPDAHYRTSSFCWAMYLRIMRRWLEYGEAVPYDRRLDA